MYEAEQMSKSSTRSPLLWNFSATPAPEDDAASSSVEAGVDEAGRGSLCGPVYAGAVAWGPPDRQRALSSDPRMLLVRDSKKLSAAQRERARAFIEAEALGWAVASVSAADVDRINVLRASMLAMRRALGALEGGEHAGSQPAGFVACRPLPSSEALSFVVVDGDRFEGHVSRAGELLPYACVPDGDGLYLSIAAASILAKTHRDALLLELHARHPLYAWDRNKGYGTADHMRALREHGPCVEHRITFSLPDRSAREQAAARPDPLAPRREAKA